MKKIFTALATTLISFNAFAETSNKDSNEQINHAEYEETFEEEFSEPSPLMNTGRMSQDSASPKQPEQASEAPKHMEMKEYKKKPKDTVY